MAQNNNLELKDQEIISRIKENSESFRNSV